MWAGFTTSISCSNVKCLSCLQSSSTSQLTQTGAWTLSAQVCSAAGSGGTVYVVFCNTH